MSKNNSVTQQCQNCANFIQHYVLLENIHYIKAGSGHCTKGESKLIDLNNISNACEFWQHNIVNLHKDVVRSINKVINELTSVSEMLENQ